MNQIKVLIEGYAHPGNNNSYIASPTTTLIRHRSKIILVDPGTNSKKLLTALSKEDLKPDDISFIYLTHFHPDHFLNIKLFPRIDVYDGTTAWKSDKEYFHKDIIPGTNIEILSTPGHSDEHTSLLLDTRDLGKVCIAADVFWWEDGKQQSEDVKDLMNLKDPFANNLDSLRKSRKKVLESADWIIPGHGKMFRNPLKATSSNIS